MTDKKALDRLEGINLSVDQKKALIDVIKNIKAVDTNNNYKITIIEHLKKDTYSNIGEFYINGVFYKHTYSSDNNSIKIVSKDGINAIINADIIIALYTTKIEQNDMILKQSINCNYTWSYLKNNDSTSVLFIYTDERAIIIKNKNINIEYG